VTALSESLETALVTPASNEHETLLSITFLVNGVILMVASSVTDLISLFACEQ